MDIIIIIIKASKTLFTEGIILFSPVCFGVFFFVRSIAFQWLNRSKSIVPLWENIFEKLYCYKEKVVRVNNKV